MKVYLVTDGDYSDYRIKAAFATKELAEAFIAHPQGGGSVEEYDALDSVPSPERWFVVQRWRGSAEVKRHSFLHWPWEGSSFNGEKRKSWNYTRWDGNERAFGTDEAAVEKCWKEQHAAEDAEKAGIS